MYRSLKRKAILKIPSIAILEKPMLFFLALKCNHHGAEILLIW